MARDQMIFTKVLMKCLLNNNKRLNIINNKFILTIRSSLYRHLREKTNDCLISQLIKFNKGLDHCLTGPFFKNIGGNCYV